MKGVLILFGCYCIILAFCFYAGYKDNAPMWFYYYVTGCATIMFIAISGIIDSIDRIGK